MAIIVNGIPIPTNGDYIIANGIKITRVVANGITVWEKNASVTPPDSAIMDYIDIQGGNEGIQTSGCEDHAGAPLFIASVWYIKEGEHGSDDITFVARPKAPYNSMKATLHWETFSHDDHDGAVGVWVNGSEIYYSKEWDVAEKSGYITVEGPSITIRVHAECQGWEGHWKTTASVCMYDVTVS